ncbi:B3/4 domain [Blomia tropicalis]|nr:B3/4 domain [Blomia tropicalis]
MAFNWSELARQRPHEIVLSGNKIAKQIEDDGGQLNDLVYGINSLNFLEITNTLTLKSISSNIIKLANLTNLVLQGNKLTTIPVEIGSLVKLKCIDLSRNELTSLPENFFVKLTNLQTLNLEQNNLKSLPDMSTLINLIVLKFGSNSIDQFPSSLCNKIYKKPDNASSPVPVYEGGAIHLSELFASHNQIDSIPTTIRFLIAIKTLDLSYNKIINVPGEISDCSKLKDLVLKENPLKDRRLYKMIEQCPTKKVLDYIRNNISFAKEVKEQSSKLSNSGENCEEDISFTCNKSITVKHTPEKVFKATIATHDLCKILPPPKTYATQLVKSPDFVEPPEIPPVVYFDGRVPTKIKLVPLGRASEVTAMELYRSLNEEADQFRKEKKRNTISGVHKYIHLLKGKQLYPVLLNFSKDKVISLPPLTNADFTKISAETRDVFVEVTGQSVPTCREVMNELINQFLSIEVSTESESGKLESIIPVKPDGSNGSLIIEPVVVETVEGELVVKYPAKIDLQLDNVQVEVQ